MKLIFILAASVIVFIVYSCCVVGGKADDAYERYMREQKNKEINND